MVIVRLKGGLGNQMFQYAAGRSLALAKKTSLKLDLDFLFDRTPREGMVFRDYNLDVFSVETVIATRKEVASMFKKESDRTLLGRIRQKVWPTECMAEPHFQYVERFFDLPTNTYLDGYWQSERYFKGCESVVRQGFQFRRPIVPQSVELLRAIESSTSVCVTVRRTDFLTNNYHGVCDMSYFDPAMRLMRERLKSPRFFVFSDDEAWCARNFPGPDVTVVGPEQESTDVGNKLQLRARCKHFIVANSSFAWWAAWLGKKVDTIVVAPKRWFADQTVDTSDLIPQDWIRLDN